MSILAVNDHDDAAGPEEQRAEAGAEEPVAAEPKGTAAHRQQPPHALPRALTSQVSPCCARVRMRGFQVFTKAF